MAGRPPLSAPSDPYSVLGVAVDASYEDVRKAYRALARQWHPDKRPDDPSAEQRFKEIAAAWAVLGDDTARRAHDRARGLAARGVVDDEELEAVAAAVDRAEAWLWSGVLPQIAARWRGVGAEATGWAALNVAALTRPGPAPAMGYFTARRAAQLSREVALTLGEAPGESPLRVIRHRDVWELRVVPRALLSAGYGPGTDLDDVVMRLVIEGSVWALAAGRFVPPPPDRSADEALAAARVRDDAAVQAVARKVALWSAVAAVIALMMWAGKNGW